MLDMVLLGTGGMCPMPIRALASCYVRIDGKGYLFDTGEGTQVELNRCGVSAADIDYICVTHLHADHVSGLMGILLAIKMGERSKDITIIGPVGIKQFVNNFYLILPKFPYNIIFVELSQKGEDLSMSIGPVVLKSVKAFHSVPCYGYSVELKRRPTFNHEKAKSLGIPQNSWSVLSKGNDLEYNGVIYKHSDFEVGKKKGVKFSYVTDTRPTKQLRNFLAGSDIAIVEGMFREPEDVEKAKFKKHMTWDESASLVNDNGVGVVILTHFSPGLQIEKGDNQKLKEKIPNGRLGVDGLKIHLDFPEVEEVQKEKNVVDKIENKESDRLPIAKEFLKLMGLLPVVEDIEVLGKFKFLITLFGDVKYNLYVYKANQSIQKMQEEGYDVYREVKNHHVFYKRVR